MCVKPAVSPVSRIISRALYWLMRIAAPVVPLEARLQGATYFVNCFRDFHAWMKGTTDPEIPPGRLNISGAGPFRSLGEHNLELCKEYGALSPDDAVLDVGCGIGRTALALTRFLSAEGCYLGFDTIDFAIRWCNDKIAPRHSQFRFIHTDVYNKVYGPRGSINPNEFSFPVMSGTISFCLATSVFTHLLPDTTERYLMEVARVLRNGGRFLSTWFLLDETTETCIREGKAEFNFAFRFENHAQVSRGTPEIAVAYQLDYLKATFGRAGLEITRIAHGGWSGAADRVNSGQDVITCQVLRA